MKVVYYIVQNHLRKVQYQYTWVENDPIHLPTKEIKRIGFRTITSSEEPAKFLENEFPGQMIKLVQLDETGESLFRVNSNNDDLIHQERIKKAAEEFVELMG